MTIIKTNFEYRKPLIPLDIDNVNYIIVHDVAWKYVTPIEIHQDVLNDPKKITWSGFPYNEMVMKNGDVYIGRGDYIGAQCAGYNSISYGIACEGDYDNEMMMPEIQKQKLTERIILNRARFRKYKATVPHNLLYDTVCPGKYFPLTEILKRIEVIKVTLEDAIKLQVEEGVINSPDYRLKVCDTTIHEKDYVINVGKKLMEKNNEIERLKLLINK